MWIDFKSDTVTKPSKAMKEFMIEAEVGDDVFGEDPTINELEDYSAKLFGKEAGLFCCSGTQTNQIAIQVYCKPGDEVICAADAHIYKYEGGGIARNAGASVKLIQGDRGRINAYDVITAINDPENVHYPISALVALEDTMNRGGGAIYDFQEVLKIKEVCRKNNLPLHLDGARVFNRLVASPIDYIKYGNAFDSISICLSKGLGAPVGSVLIGSKEFIRQARRVRKVMGGGMRQAGIIAAGGLFALQNNIAPLTKDHQKAQELGKTLLENPWIESVSPVETNIVVGHFHTSEKLHSFLSKLNENQIIAMPFGDKQIRFVTHLDISEDQLQKTIEVIRKIS